MAETTIKLAVASNFAAPVKAIVANYPHSTDNIRVSLGSSGKFYAQIRQGAPFDIFLSADTDKPDKLVAEGFAIKSSRFTYGIGKLVLWSGNPRLLQTTPPDWQQLQFDKIAIANPRTAPYGLAAQQYLQQQYPEILTSRQRVTGENIAQAFAYVRSGNAQLGFVALSQVLTLAEQNKGSWWIIPETYYDPILQDAVLLTEAQHNAAALQFYQYLQSAEVAAMIRAFGYDTTEGN